MENSDWIKEATRTWVNTVVIGLNLCPFAKREEVRGRIRYAVSEADNHEQLLLDLHGELELVLRDITIETTLLIHPFVLQDFYVYNDFFVYADGLLEQMDLEGVFQIASFHPDYQFAGTLPDDVENYTNRSPYPMLHILREASLDLAIDSHPDIDSVPKQNMRLMREMGPEQMKLLLRNCFRA